MPTAYILVGVPGSGKSTWASNQEWFKDCSYISTDSWVHLEANKQGKTYSEVFTDYMPKAVHIMTEHVILAREAEEDIIWDQTSTTITSRKKKFNMLPNYKMIAVVFPTPDQLELSIRLKNRPGKEIPQDVLNSMIDGWEEPTTDEGFDEIWMT